MRIYGLDFYAKYVAEIQGLTGAKINSISFITTEIQGFKRISRNSVFRKYLEKLMSSVQMKQLISNFFLELKNIIFSFRFQQN